MRDLEEELTGRQKLLLEDLQMMVLRNSILKDFVPLITSLLERGSERKLDH